MKQRARDRSSWLARLAPGVGRLRRYDRSRLGGDVVGGVTVAAYMIPQVMAMAVVAGLAPVAGLYAVVAALAVYALVGSSPQLSCGPDSTSALMTAAAVAPLAAGDPDRYATLAAGLAVMVAVICIVAWVARLGFLTNLLSKPVLVGYMAGVAVIMVAGQLGKLTGVEVSGDSLVDEVRSFVADVEDVHGPSLAVAGATLVFLLVATRLAPRWPVPLIGMVLATVVVALAGLDDDGVALIGAIPAGFPTPSVPDLAADDLAALLVAAVGVTIVTYSDNVLVARGFAVRHGDRIDPNQEFLALGAANAAAGAVGGFPVSSSGSRTAIADALGARTQVASIVALVSVAPTLLFLRPLLARFPSPALGALIVYAALRLVDVAELRRLGRFRTSELVIAVATAGGVLVIGVLDGILIAVGFSILDMVRRVARPHDGVLGFVPGVAGMHDIDDYPDAELVPGLVVYRYDAPLFFANAEDFRQRALASLELADGPVEWFLLNAEANMHVDITSIDVLEEVRAELERQGIVFAMARVKRDLFVELDDAGFIERVGRDRIFPTLPTAVRAYAEWYTERHGSPPPGLQLRA